MEQSKLNTVSYTVNVGTNANPDNIKVRIPIIDHPSPIEYARWQQKYTRLVATKQWGNAHVRQHVNLQQLLDGHVAAVYSANIANDPPQNIGEVAAAMQAVAISVYGPHARNEWFKKIQRAKSFNQSVEQFAKEFRELVTLTRHLPAGQNGTIEEIDQMNYFVNAMPKAWISNYRRSGQQYATLQEVITYFQLQEEPETRQGNRPTREANKPSSLHQRLQRTSKRRNNLPNKTKRWCSFHKAHTHSNEECRAQKINHEANVISHMEDEIITAEESHQPCHPPASEIMTLILGKTQSTMQSALVDTGATSSLINRANLPPATKLRSAITTFRMATSSFTSNQIATIQIKFPELAPHRTITHEFKIVDGLSYPLIIGRDLLALMGARIDFASSSIEWDGHSVVMPQRRNKIERTTATALSTKTFQMDMEPKSVISTQKRTMRILDAKYEQSDIPAMVAHLSPNDQEIFLPILNKYPEIFDGSLGTWKGPKYEIPIPPTTKPIACKSFSIPHIHEKVTRNEIERLCKIGVLTRDIHSPWAAPCFIIPKKNGTVRIVTDYRKLNRHLIRQPFPLPKIPELLHGLENVTHFSSLDLAMGYYQIPLSEQSSRMTTFILPFGKFRYLRMPMGIASAPDEFQARMSLLLGDLPFVRIYLDDCLIITKGTPQDHANAVETVLDRFHENGITCNGSKSLIAVQEIEYLGYTLTTAGIQPQAKKTQAILKIAPPSNKRELRRFIGMVNYYRDTWRPRAHLLAPLTELTKKQVKFTWTAELQKQFDQIKQHIAQQVTLTFPNYTQPFEIYTDASTRQLGGGNCPKQKATGFLLQKTFIITTKVLHH